MGAWVPVSQLAEEEVAAYRQLEEERIGKVLDDLVELCQSQKVENLLPFQILLFFFWLVVLSTTPMPSLSMSIWVFGAAYRFRRVQMMMIALSRLLHLDSACYCQCHLNS